MNAHSHNGSERLSPGTAVHIVKLKPNGAEAIRYPGEIIKSPDGWVAARCPWGQRRVDLGYLTFEPNDIFLEFFALEQFFNAFAIHTSDGELKGWYCNVTLPSWVEDHTVYWHDLYIDVVAYPDGRMLVLDEDELAGAKLEATDPALHERILKARDQLLGLIAAGDYPFDQSIKNFPTK